MARTPSVSDTPSTIAPSARASAPPELCLLVMGPGVFVPHTLPAEGTVVVGRASDCGIRLEDPVVSRRHLRVRVRAEGSARSVWVEDLRSANGSRLRQLPIPPGVPQQMFPGDLLRMGDTALVLEESGHDSATTDAGPSRELSGELAEALLVLQADPVTQTLAATTRRAAAGHINVLVQGETGVGKDVMARLLHALSPRRNHPFVAINCAAVPEPLVESELFGHERGAFTGATGAKPGLLESAPGGTVFLDEAGDMSLATQAKLLVALEARQVTRLGSVRPRAIDVRLVAASNRSLRQEAEAGRFRADLYYRVAGMTLHVPPLRERRTSLHALAQRFLAAACRATGRSPLTFSPHAITAIDAHDWPGNVRELRNAIDRAVLLCVGPAVQPDHLFESTQDRSIVTRGDVPTERRTPYPEGERIRVEEALRLTGGNQSRAARQLGMSRKAFVARLDAFGITRPRKGAHE